MMDRAILGDNQFFAVNHLSDERSRAQAIRFKDNRAIIDVLDQAMECGVNTFMCTTHVTWRPNRTRKSWTSIGSRMN